MIVFLEFSPLSNTAKTSTSAQKLTKVLSLYYSEMDLNMHHGRLLFYIFKNKNKATSAFRLFYHAEHTKLKKIPKIIFTRMYFFT